ncbi:MAG: DUF3822 family protein [Sphingobacteriales bacterium]|nr:DUF3822 family protein [Sphingobacteriales bacterium]
MADITDTILAETLTEMFATENLLQHTFNKVDVIYAFNESMLVPYQFNGVAVNEEMLALVFGNGNDKIIKSDFIARHNVYNIYQVPGLINSLINKKFQQANFTHQYTAFPNIYKMEGNHLCTIFGANNMAVMLLKDGKLQMVQNFKYKQPEDAVYYLLSICNGFDVDTNNVIVHLNGMIDKNSALYKEIYDYFLTIEFATMPDTFSYTEAITEYPAHFFSHLFAIASCV